MSGLARCGLALLLLALSIGCTRRELPRPEDPGAGNGETTSAQTTKVREVVPIVPDQDDPWKPVDRSTLQTPWARAKVGDWATYETKDGPLRVEVLETDASSVTIRRGDDTERLSLRRQENRWAKELDPGRLDATRFDLRPGARAFGDLELECLVVKPVRGGTEAWYSEEVPLLDGIVYQKQGDEVVRELTGFGSAE